MKKEKLTLQQQLAKKRFTVPTTFWWGLYSFLAKTPIFGAKYKATYKIIDDINDCKGPCFVIWNHLSRRDYLFIKNITCPKKFNMLAGYGEFFRSHLKFVFDVAHVMPKKNFTNDPVGIRAMNDIIKAGGCVAFSPEGMSSIYGHNQPIVAGTGRFLQFYHIPVYFVHLEGSYLSSNKICIDDRVGKVNAEISLLFTPEQLKAMTPQAIEDKINEVFRFDDYEWNKTARVKFNSKGRICTGLADICYKCPKCGEELHMEAHDDFIKCPHCGNGAKMNDYYDFLPFDDTCVIPESPSKWVDWERTQVIKEIRENPNYEFVEHVKIGELPKYKRLKHLATTIPCGEGDITINHSGIHFKGLKNGEPWEFELSYKMIYSLVIENETNIFSLFVNEEMYDFIPARASVGKILLLVEEMHRLHFNTWKNFPWCDYMYEGMELPNK